jgi:Sensors of blue-light using FAD
MIDDSGIFQLLYCSLAKQPMAPEALAAMLHIARKKNAVAQITGLLMVHDGIYMQWLEGPEEQVKALWSKLKTDPRHYCVVKLLEIPQAQSRAYPKWSMREVSRDQLLSMVRQADTDNLDNPWGQAVQAMHELLEQPDTHHYITAQHSSQQKNTV